MNVLFLLLLPLACHAELLDKIYGVFNDKILTLSDAKRIQGELEARAEVAPMVYGPEIKELEDVREIFFKQNIIRHTLDSYGYELTDSVIEDRIAGIEKSQGITRDDLIGFLQERDLNYETYFELIKLSMEYSYFTNKIIAPLISVSNQEIKNAFYKHFPNERSVSFRFDIVDIVLPEEILKIYSYQQLIEILTKYKETAMLPEALRDMEANRIDDVESDNLSEELAELLAKTPINSFSETIKMNGQLHIFYIENKQSTPSSVFNDNKETLNQMVSMSKAKNVEKNWFEINKENFYIKEF